MRMIGVPLIKVLFKKFRACHLDRIGPVYLYRAFRIIMQSFKIKKQPEPWGCTPQGSMLTWNTQELMRTTEGMIMSGKYNTRHNRKRSNYPQRLKARGLSKTPKMPSLESLRARHLDKHGNLRAEYGQGGHTPTRVIDDDSLWEESYA